MAHADGLLVYAHVGDLHVTTERQQNYIDLLSIAAQIETQCAPMLDFVFLPGDNADNGLPSQYRLVATAMKMLSVPVHAITGDHDMEQGSLEAFYAGLGAERLPKAVTVGRVRCLFVDMCGPGAGGPDFRLDAAQIEWLDRTLAEATRVGETKALFMHSYPADLRTEGQTDVVNRLIHDHAVRLVDMGHTHYNELANNGRTVFAATRSTGQIEEGPVGYTLAAIDRGVVSWRFKLLDEAFPAVMITAPADHRLVTEPADPAQVIGTSFNIRALVFGARRITRCDYRIGESDWMPMSRPGDGRCWCAEAVAPSGQPLLDLTVRAVDASGRPGQDTIKVAVGVLPARKRLADGSDGDAIGAWPEKGIVGTQLGPNRNAPGGS